MKIYDLSQDLNQDCSFWPFYPPFEVKYIKRKSEHGVNAQYIQTSNHMGTHLDAPRHFVTKGKTIDQIPIEWCYGPGVIVDLSDMLDDLGLFTPEDIEKRADIREGDILLAIGRSADRRWGHQKQRRRCGASEHPKPTRIPPHLSQHGRDHMAGSGNAAEELRMFPTPVRVRLVAARSGLSKNPQPGEFSAGVNSDHRATCAELRPICRSQCGIRFATSRCH